MQIPDAALVAAAELSGRYISGRLLPDKAVDLVDTAAARVKIALSARPDALEDTERQIQTLTRERDAYQRDLRGQGEPDDAHVADLESRIAELAVRRDELHARWQTEKKAVDEYLKDRDAIIAGGNGQPEAAKLKAALAALKKIQGATPFIPLEVSPEVVGKVVADWTGIPVGNMVKDEAQTILMFADRLRERIKGQDWALDSVATGIRASKAGLQDPSKPIGVFLFVGPSGVGKTETALGVADLLFGGERFMTTINMSEFQEKHTVSRLIGSPPGYVGFGEGGVLTEAVRQRPYSVVLLDEVEKADPEVMNLFYQVFDKGMLSDGEGRIIDFKNTVIFMTSNLATNEITALGMQETPPSHEDVTSAIRPVLNKHFKPALVGRMTIVPFFPLKPEAIARIVRLKLDRVATRLRESHKMALSWEEAVIDRITERCTEVETGARNIDHIIQGSMLPLMSSELLQRMTAGPLPDTLHLGLDDAGGFSLKFGA